MTRDTHHRGLAYSAQEEKLADRESGAVVLSRLEGLQNELSSTPGDNPQRRAELNLDIAGILLDLDRKDEAHAIARPLIEALIDRRAYEDAALACQFVYLADGEDAVPALGQAAWLSVSCPVDPNLTANILSLIIDETPDDADGAAVAAAVAHYVADMRASDTSRDDLKLFTGGLLADVARRHSNIESQEAFEHWVERLELDNPDRFLVRFRNVIDVLVQDDWWFDRQAVERTFADH